MTDNTSPTDKAKLVSGVIPTADSGIVAIELVSEDGTIGYLVGKEAFAHQSSEHITKTISQIGEITSLKSEADVLIGAIACSTLVFGSEAVNGFAGASAKLMHGDSLVGRLKRFAVLKEIDDETINGVAVSSILLKIVDESQVEQAYGELNDDDGISIVPLERLFNEVAWDKSDDIPYTIGIRGKNYTLPLN